VIINARKEAGLLNPDSNENMEVDIYLPSLNLGFEYHVHNTHLKNLYRYFTFIYLFC